MVLERRRDALRAARRQLKTPGAAPGCGIKSYNFRPGRAARRCRCCASNRNNPSTRVPGEPGMAAQSGGTRCLLLLTAVLGAQCVGLLGNSVAQSRRHSGQQAAWHRPGLGAALQASVNKVGGNILRQHGLARGNKRPFTLVPPRIPITVQPLL